MAITEGIAVALAPEGRKISLHQSAGNLLKKGHTLEVESFMNPWFWGKSPKRSYTLAGSFILFLIDNFSF